MKRAYNKHVYSGHKVNPKRSRAGILRYHGSEMAGRRQAWRDDIANAQKTEPQPTTSIQRNRSGSPVTLRGLSDDKKYKAVHSSRTQTQLHISANSQKAEPQPTTSTERNRSGSPVTLRDSSDDKKFKAVHSSKPNANLPPEKQKALEGLNTSTAPITWPPRDPEVEKHELTIEVEKKGPHNFDSLDGYRIVDIKYVLNWAINLQSDHAKECTCAKVKFIDEDRDGLSSVYIFECVMCEKKWHMCSEEKNKINKSFVWGTLTAASYYSQSTHMLAIMDIPSMSADKFKMLEIKFGEIWQEHLWEEMQEAAKQKRDIAVQKGHVSPDGVPYKCVYVDGGWCKRTYGHNFNASSGVACIIGVETKKCLFLGIKNKFCNICVHNEKKWEEKEHLCFRNYKGSSTAMEVDILVEGFSKSVELHGLRFTSFVGDGDSSVFSRLKDKVPYGNTIKKKECKNHVMKNYTSALYKIQGQLRASSRDYCYMICFIDLSTPILTIKVQKDEDFIQEMLQKLVVFYKTCVLPETILRRVPANHICRDPPSFSGSCTNRTKKKEV